MKRIILVFISLLATFVCFAQKTAPGLEFVMELRVTVGQAFSVGKTHNGERLVIPITGGTFSGPRLKGEVLEGGADYQLISRELRRTDLEAIYCIRTDDGVNIHVRNIGISAYDGGKNYFYCTPRLEAPMDSKYAWLNNAIYVCRPGEFMKGGVVLDVWKVTDSPAIE